MTCQMNFSKKYDFFWPADRKQPERTDGIYKAGQKRNVNVTDRQKMDGHTDSIKKNFVP